MLPVANIKVVNMRAAQVTLSALVRDAQSAPVCLTRYGKPLAIVLGVEGQRWPEIFHQWDPGLSKAGLRASGDRRRRRPRQDRA
jgi:hypothetical protein